MFTNNERQRTAKNQSNCIISYIQYRYCCSCSVLFCSSTLEENCKCHRTGRLNFEKHETACSLHMSECLQNWCSSMFRSSRPRKGIHCCLSLSGSEEWDARVFKTSTYHLCFHRLNFAFFISGDSFCLSFYVRRINTHEEPGGFQNTSQRQMEAVV